MVNFSTPALYVSSTRILTKYSHPVYNTNKEHSTMVIEPYEFIEVTHKCLHMLFLKLKEQVVICHWWTSSSISVIGLLSPSLIYRRFQIYPFTFLSELTYLCLLILVQRLLHNNCAFEEISWEIYQAMGESRWNGIRWGKCVFVGSVLYWLIIY